MNITAIILTYNEEIHLARCLQSIQPLRPSIVIVDSFSTDNTAKIGESFGARILVHPFLSHASQFNWALTQLNDAVEWVLRLDADEYLTPALIDEIQAKLPSCGTNITGVYCGRRVSFQGKMIRFGGVFPIQVLRLFRREKGQCENRWMDEHIKVIGETAIFKGEIMDDNLQPLSWWTAKHNTYSSREAVDLLNLKYRFLPHDSIASINRNSSQASVKRWIKELIYARLPGGFRALVYFFYRYVLRFGFLDGEVGATFHFLQGFWYRYLVDCKIAEVERYIKNKGCNPCEAIQVVLGISLSPANRDTSSQ